MALGDFNMVNVMINFIRSQLVCNVKKRGNCRKKALYVVFADDGKPKLSRLIYTTCKFHLPMAVDRAWEYNKGRSKK